MIREFGFYVMIEKIENRRYFLEFDRKKYFRLFGEDVRVDYSKEVSFC